MQNILRWRSDQFQPYLESLVKQNWCKFRGLCLHNTSVVILPNDWQTRLTGNQPCWCLQILSTAISIEIFRENGVQFGQEKSRKDRTVELRLQLMNLQGRLPIKNRWVHFSTWMLTSRRCSRLLVKGFMWTRMAKKLCLLRDVVKEFSRQDLYGSKVEKCTDPFFIGKRPCRQIH